VGENCLLVSRSLYKTLCDSMRDKSISPQSHALWDMISSFCPYDAETDSLVLIMDNGRYVNHSDDPNSGYVNGNGIALRDIVPGEEILENYNEYDNYCWPEPWDDFSEDIIHSIDSSLRKAYAEAHPDEDFDYTACSKLNCTVRVAGSEEKGMALVLDSDVKAGEVLWSEKGSVFRIPQKAWEAFEKSCMLGSSTSLLFQQAAMNYGYYDRESNALLITLDNGRFKNHSSDNPSGKTIRTSDGLLQTVAARDLKSGSEIEEDYNAYDVCPWPGVSFQWEKNVEGYKQSTP